MKQIQPMSLVVEHVAWFDVHKWHNGYVYWRIDVLKCIMEAVHGLQRGVDGGCLTAKAPSGYTASIYAVILRVPSRWHTLGM
jgi:hypothetical protein